MLGHVDSGKSTLLGHLFFTCGGISRTRMKQFEDDAVAGGRLTHRFADVVNAQKIIYGNMVACKVSTSMFFLFDLATEIQNILSVAVLIGT